MQITALGVQVAGSNYTWAQTWRFFAIGMVKAVIYGLIPVGIVLWHNYENYSDPVDWALIRWMVLGAVGPVVYSYWSEHKALLKPPPFFQIPPEFQPTIKQTEHTVTTTETHTEIIAPKPPDENH